MSTKNDPRYIRARVRMDNVLALVPEEQRAEAEQVVMKAFDDLIEWTAAVAFDALDRVRAEEH